MLSISSEHKLRSENLPFDIDVWYPKLTQFTFHTYLIPLTRTQAKSIILYYIGNNRIRNVLYKDEKFGVRDIDILNELEKQIEEVIKSNSTPTETAADSNNDEKQEPNTSSKCIQIAYHA